ncbi:hypothetical protein PG985_003134 [Apiospora marii]|uniref:uncharacterized protein n=1 Tax=Apiospora marii TaxID=335849 RepID=UPI00312D4056
MSGISIRKGPDIGAVPPPPGATPNFEHPADGLWTVNIAGLIVCNVIVLVVYGLRCYSKYTLKSPTTVEDLGYCGEGHHIWELTREDYQAVMKWLYASSIVWIPTAFFTKASLLLLTARLFSVYRRTARYIRLYVWFLLIAYTPIQFVKIFICWPIAHYWDSSLPGRCLDQPKVFLTDTALAFVTDFIILVIPIPLTWKLNMPLRKKMKVAGMLGAGGIAVAVACFREYKIYIFQWSTDVTRDFVVMNLCGTIEITIGIVCLCLPSINLLFERATSQKTSQNRPRTIYERFSNSRKKTSVGLSERTTVFLQEDRSAGSGGPEMTAAPVLDFDAELAMFTDEPRTGCVVESPPTGINGTNSDGTIWEGAGGCARTSCMNISSADGRKEGWLTSNDDDPGASNSQHVCGPPRRPGYGNMEQFRRESQRILVPGRIWDGRGRCTSEVIT